MLGYGVEKESDALLGEMSLLFSEHRVDAGETLTQAFIEETFSKVGLGALLWGSSVSVSS